MKRSCWSLAGKKNMATHTTSTPNTREIKSGLLAVCGSTTLQQLVHLHPSLSHDDTKTLYATVVFVVYTCVPASIRGESRIYDVPCRVDMSRYPSKIVVVLWQAVLVWIRSPMNIRILRSSSNLTLGWQIGQPCRATRISRAREGETRG